MVWKWMDGRIVKDDPVRGGMDFVVSRMLCTTKASGDAISSCRWGESSHGSLSVGVEGRAWGAKDGKWIRWWTYLGLGEPISGRLESGTRLAPYLISTLSFPIPVHACRAGLLSVAFLVGEVSPRVS